MGDSKVETISSLVRWKVDSYGTCSCKKSDPFSFGIWSWCVSVEKGESTRVRLSAEMDKSVQNEQLPIATFELRLNAGPGHRCYKCQVKERLLGTTGVNIWFINTTPIDCFVLDVEFLDIKIHQQNCEGNGDLSAWRSVGSMQSQASQRSLHCLDRIFTKSMHTDVTINTSCGGVLHAHKAVLSAMSPVFERMFVHHLKEESVVVIDDISLEPMRAFLKYIYGTIKHTEFWENRPGLLVAAHKYDIVELKRSCEDTLMEDINSNNVWSRFLDASQYQLGRLKETCMTYLISFGKIYDLKDEEIGKFLSKASKELTLELFQQVLKASKTA